MDWVEIFGVLVICHLAGDYLIQTGFQATHKHGGLGSDPVQRRALASHTFWYTLCFVPALVWLADGLALGALEVALVALAIGVPHGIQDDGRLLRAWLRVVKRTEDGDGPLFTSVDQSFHLVALFVLAVVVGQ